MNDGSDDTSFQSKAHEKLTGETKVTLTSGGKSTTTTMGAIKALAESGKIKDVEGLLSLHNDEQTTREVNKDWRELRQTIDSRASLEEKTIKGSLTIKIEYEADSDTGKKEIKVTRALSLPKPPSNKRTLYEMADGTLSTVKPSKNLDLFDNVKPIRKGV